MSVQNGTFTRTNSFGPGDDRLIPRFHINSIPDPIATEREGRPIFRDREEVELISPGNPYNIPNEIVTDDHRRRWAREYEAFRKGIDISPEGTPLEQWPLLKPSQVKELKALDFATVEQVAGMNDHATQRFMGGMRLRTLAKAFLDEASHTAELSKATADNERKDQRIAELERKVEELSILLNSTHANLQELRNAPSPTATAVPMMFDPAERSKPMAAQESGPSSLGDLPEPRRRGRPPKEAVNG